MSEIDYSKYVRREPSPEQEEDVAVRPDMVGDNISKEEAATMEAEGTRESGLIATLRRLFGGDKVLWVIIIALMAISVLVVYSSTAKMAYMPSSSNSTSEFLRNQLLLLVGSAVFMIGAHRINSHWYRRAAYIVFIIALGLSLADHFVGTSTNGAARWINIAGFQFQPSEML